MQILIFVVLAGLQGPACGTNIKVGLKEARVRGWFYLVLRTYLNMHLVFSNMVEASSNVGHTRQYCTRKHSRVRDGHHGDAVV